MRVKFKPSLAHGEITAPPSKSFAHRALICGALSSGSKINNIAISEDISATLNALKNLGAQIDCSECYAVIGGLLQSNTGETEIYVNESGSTLRFLIPLSLLSGNKTVFKGADRLFERDLSVYEQIAKEQDILFCRDKNSITVCGTLKGGEFNIRGDISSQFVSGLMFALPLLKDDSFISFTSPLQSKPYIDMTADVLSHFGVEIKYTENGYFIKGSQIYRPCEYTVEGDYSNSAFLDAFNLLGGSVSVNGLNNRSLQGDKIYKEIFKKIENYGTYDLSDCPDLAPVLFAISANLSGARFKGTERLKIKESDRAECMKEELEKFGAQLIVSNNEVIVEKSVIHAPSSPLSSHGDHRIVMALSVLLSVYGGEIEGAEAVNKSYPQFFSDIKKLGIEVEIQ